MGVVRWCFNPAPTSDPSPSKGAKVGLLLFLDERNSLRRLSPPSFFFSLSSEPDSIGPGRKELGLVFSLLFSRQ